MSQVELGPIRPPSEANSMLLRVTRNCPWNRCKFCTLYKDEKFSPRSVEEIKSDIDVMYGYKKILTELNQAELQKKLAGLNSEERYHIYSMANWLQSAEKSVFLQDANSIVLKSEKLAEALQYLNEKFPEIGRITSYARADTLARLSLEDLKLLRKSGLDRIHSGYETGSDNILKMISKGTTQQQQIEGGKKVKEAGMELSIYYMPGVGGKEHWEESAIETAKVVNSVNPDFLRIRTFVVKEESGMWYDMKSGIYTQCTDYEKVIELESMIKELNNITTTIKSDHIVNLLENVEGKMMGDKNIILSRIKELHDLKEEDRRFYQLARRMATVRNISDVSSLSLNQKRQIGHILSNLNSEEKFEGTLNELLRRYI
ncbi:MAG: radical SAM protein [Peptostreptococcales bacterium]|jgi:radical SAM superfamily enzyme YgiQ (UPF0313 family)